MNLIGISLYIFWLLLVVLKFSTLPHNRSFSYQQAFFGTLIWYKNFRNLLLLCSLLVLVIFAPLKMIYLLFFITACLTFLMSMRNFWTRVGNAWIGISLSLVSLLISIGTGLFVFKT